MHITRRGGFRARLEPPDLDRCGVLLPGEGSSYGQLAATPGKFWLAKKSIVLCG